MLFLEHIRDSISLVENYIGGKGREDFLNDVQLQDSILRRIEIIGEAVKNLPEGLKKDYPQVDWKGISGMRDVIIHGYFGVDLDLTWMTLEKDLPNLKHWIERMISDLSERSSS